MMGRVLKILGGLLVLCAVVVGGIIGAAFFLTQDAANAGDAFMKAIQEERLDDAYALLGGEALDDIDLDTFTANFSDAELTSWTFNNRSVNNDDGQLDGTAVFAGETYNVTLVLRKIDDAWLIVGYNLEQAASDEE